MRHRGRELGHEAFDRCAAFLDSIGISVSHAHEADGFLPGLRIRRRTIQVAVPDDTMAGDLLHEAGHIAVTPSILVEHLDGDAEGPGLQAAAAAWLDAHPDCMGHPEDPVARAILQSGEMEAIAWSYAAAMATGVDTFLPFAKGFQGGGADVWAQISLGRHFGIHGLAAGGMTQHFGRGGEFAFPRMRRWLQI